MHVTNFLLLQIANIIVDSADKYFVLRVHHLQLKLRRQDIRFVFVMHVMKKLCTGNLQTSHSYVLLKMTGRCLSSSK